MRATSQHLPRRAAERHAVAARAGRATRRSRRDGREAGRREAGREAGETSRPTKPADKPRRRRPRRSASTSTGSSTAILDLPITAGDALEPAGRRRGAASTTCRTRGRRDRRCNRYDLTDAQERDAASPDVSDYVVSADGKKLLYRNGDDWSIVADDRSDPAGGRTDRRRHDRGADRSAAEWKQIFDEAWRINRDYFYAPEHARRRLAEAEGEVRGVPAARRRRAPT